MDKPKLIRTVKPTDQSDQYMLTRKILLSGDIDESEIQEAARKMLLLAEVYPGEEMTLLIDSYGGEVYESLFMIDLIESLGCDVRTVVIGKAMSAAFAIAISGTPGKRFITKHGVMMEHEISAGAIGKASEIESCLKECRRLEKQVLDIIRERTEMPARILGMIKKQEVYFTPEECIKYKLVDGIIGKL